MNWHSLNFDWNHIRAFLATAELGTLSAAAEALNSTQPTLSRQVSALESELKITLFERVGQRLVLTSNGLALLTYAREMGSNALSFSLAASGRTQKLEGTVVISAGELTATYILPKIISGIRKEEPGINVEIVVTNAPSDLKRREADIAIRSFHPKQNDLIAKKVGDEVIWWYGSKDYLSTLPEVTSYDMIEKSIRIIGFDQTSAVTDMLNQQGWQLSQQNFPIITSFQLLQLELCKEGQGLILYPEQMGDIEPKLERALENMGAVMTLPVWLVSHQELRTSAKVRYVFDFLSDELKKIYEA